MSDVEKCRADYYENSADVKNQYSLCECCLEETQEELQECDFCGALVCRKCLVDVEMERVCLKCEKE